MDKIRVLVKEPGKPAEVREIENTLKTMQAIVGGNIEALQITENVICYLNDEGKLLKLAPNFLNLLDVICGTAVFMRADEEGNEIDLTMSDIIFLTEHLKRVAVENLEIDGKPLTELWKA